jgi:polysaccharide deacetylase family protein (PEP-CTERM system associated)
MTHHILFTIDVEDWFQVENLRTTIPHSSWPSCELRVEKNTHKLLDLLDSIKVKNTEYRSQNTVEKKSVQHDNGPRTTNNRPDEKVRGTFFVLGWIAERLPGLVREIQARGHEVASHGYGHELCSKCSLDAVEKDIAKSKRVLEDVLGSPVYGYRAPSFSIDDDILKIIQDCGYLYDSSYNAFGLHGRHGKISLNGNEKRGIAILVNQKSAIENRQFYELPISNLSLFHFPTLDTLGILDHFRHFYLPWGGGGYFRLISLPIFRRGVQSILTKDKAYLFYIHPWEIDPDQPRVNQAPVLSKFRHYFNLGHTETKLVSLLEGIRDSEFVTCRRYIEKEGGK